MYYTGDLKYMRKELKFSLNLIDFIQKKYGDELTDSQKTRIMYLLNTLKELNLDVKYLNQNPEILNCIDVYTDEEFLALMEYVKKNAKKKSPNTVIALLISAQQIIKNNRQNEVEQIMKLLEKEGLADILDNRSINDKLFKEGNYLQIYKNINILSQIKTYRSTIRKNPEIILGTTYDIQKIVSQIRQLDGKTEEKISNEENANFEQNNEQKKNEQQDNIKDDETDKEEALNPYEDTDYYLDDGKILLGMEDNVLKVIESLKKFNIPYNILFINPEICRRKNISEIDKILKILYDNDIPFNILDYSPQILQVGKSKGIMEIIKYMKGQDINLDILCICPDILIKSNVKKIQNVLEALDKEKINKNIIYSCPQVLISGNTKIFIEMKNELESTLPDINIVLDMAPYVFVQKISNMSNILDNTYSDLINRSYLSNSNRVVVVKNIDESQKIINVLREENIGLYIIKRDPKVLTRTTAKQTKDILSVVDAMEIDKKIVENNPELLVYSSAIAIKETTSKLKEYRPLKYKEIVNEIPEVYIKSDSSKIENIVKTFEGEDIQYTFIDKNPKILLREDEEEIGRVSKKIKEKGFTANQIEEVPNILIEGKEKYVDRNINVMKKNKIDLPLCSAYSMKTRKLEKNIDTFIENDLYQYIEKEPELLERNSNTLSTYFALAKIYNIPLIVDKNDRNIGDINKEYLNSSKEDLEKKYKIDKDIIKKVESKIERKKDRKIKNIELYNKIYPILEQQADICLEQYKKDDVSYTKNDKIISKQKLIRETYLDLEDSYDKKGKLAIKEFNANEKLDKKLETLTKNKKDEFNKENKLIDNKKTDKKEIILEKGE